jgi:hypothetical protein
MSFIGGGPAPAGADIVLGEVEGVSQEVRVSPRREATRRWSQLLLLHYLHVGISAFPAFLHVQVLDCIWESLGKFGAVFRHWDMLCRLASIATVSRRMLWNTLQTIRCLVRPRIRLFTDVSGPTYPITWLTKKERTFNRL